MLYQMQQPAHKGPCVDCHDLSYTAHARGSCDNDRCFVNTGSAVVIACESVKGCSVKFD